jgi:gamma-glutamyl-gamma-aminobutyraldehyde dehydrogenase
MEDASNLDYIAAQAVKAVFWNMGENCSSNSRLIIHKRHKAALTEKVVDHLEDWKTGYPLDPTCALGALVNEGHYKQVLAYIERGKEEGGTLIAGGKPLLEDQGYYIEPAVFDGLTPAMTICNEEIFGPVLSILEVGSDEEGIALANDTCYGLQASVFTDNLSKAHRAARELQAGTVTVNCYSEGDITTPFGGYKLSGFGGRDNSLLAHEQYTEMKTIWINLSDDHVDEQR